MDIRTKLGVVKDLQKMENDLILTGSLAMLLQFSQVVDKVYKTDPKVFNLNLVFEGKVHYLSPKIFEDERFKLLSFDPGFGKYNLLYVFENESIEIEIFIRAGFNFPTEIIDGIKVYIKEIQGLICFLWLIWVVEPKNRHPCYLQYLQWARFFMFKCFNDDKFNKSFEITFANLAKKFFVGDKVYRFESDVELLDKVEFIILRQIDMGDIPVKRKPSLDLPRIIRIWFGSLVSYFTLNTYKKAIRRSC